MGEGLNYFLMATLAQLRTAARLKARVASADYSTANLNIAINDAYNILASIFAGQGESYTEAQRVKINLAQNSAFYDLPGDFLKLKQARVAYSTPSAPGDYKVAVGYDLNDVRDIGADEENISTATPIVDIVGTQIKLKPTPTAAVSEGLELAYIARPSALAASADVPVLPTEIHNLMAAYAAKEVCGAMSKFDKYNAFSTEWLMGIERIKKDLAERDLNEPVRFKTPFEASRGSVSELYSK